MGGIFQNSWQGAAAEADAIGEQQLIEAVAIGEQQTKWTTSGGTVEADAIREQQPKPMQSGSNWQSRAACS